MRQFVVPLLVFILLSFNKAHSHPFLCDALMSPPDELNSHESDLDQTDRFIVYLESLLEEGIMEDDHLSYLISGLEEGRVLNSFEDQEGSAAEVQREGIQKYVEEAAKLDKKKLLKWAKQKGEERRGVRIRRRETQDKTRSPYQKMEFHPVSVGSFQMGDGKNKKKVSLTYPIEVMSTQVTQMHWVDIMGENPSFFTQGEHSVVIVRDGKTITLQPDQPVERITWWSVLVFANRLSEKHGFSPVYGLDEIVWEQDTRAEDGTLVFKGGKIKIYVNGGAHAPHRKDIYYQGEGYRLPTEAEQEYLLKAQGKERRYAFGSNDSYLEDYAWCKENADAKTHPVAQLTPLILDDGKFYDLHGNVWEWGWDWYDAHSKGGRNPSGPETGSSRVIRGGAYGDGAFNLLSCFRNGSRPNTQHIGVGFRLVRTINPRERRER